MIDSTSLQGNNIEWACTASSTYTYPGYGTVITSTRLGTSSPRLHVRHDTKRMGQTKQAPGASFAGPQNPAPLCKTSLGRIPFASPPVGDKYEGEAVDHKDCEAPLLELAQLPEGVGSLHEHLLLHVQLHQVREHRGVDGGAEPLLTQDQYRCQQQLHCVLNHLQGGRQSASRVSASGAMPPTDHARMHVAHVAHHAG